MNDFTNPDSYETRVEDVVCRDCNKTFRINAQYDKNGFPVFFRAKYCPECNKKPKITGNNGSWGTVNIESAKVPQRNVEGLEESLQTLATSIAHSQNATDESIGKLMDDFKAFKKHTEYDIEHNKNVVEESLQTLATSIVDASDEFRAFKKHAEYDIEQNTNNIKKNTDDIMTNKLNLDVFKASQAEFNTKQSDFNISILQLVKEIHKTLIIGFSVFVFFMLVTWGYLTYTHFNH